MFYSIFKLTKIGETVNVIVLRLEVRKHERKLGLIVLIECKTVIYRNFIKNKIK